ncbi:MAG: Hpt domain-containing protein [Phaeodactylibacter sp.]|nr:Hpt domain-containing protein [Phaeodactylibacter sp.]MCB9267068.1 Hpt domain-containing protein [Lewinellaceae bacterium]MCB9290082.1 Hpt domain-containing protein [Lewinellaceae bacterium]
MADLSFLKKFTRGDEAKMKRYIRIYLQMAPDIFTRMQANLVEEDWASLAINAHSLKPQADYMGIIALKETLEKIENEVKEGKTDELPRLFERAHQLHREAEAFLDAQVKQL